MERETRTVRETTDLGTTVETTETRTVKETVEPKKPQTTIIETTTTTDG